MMIEFFAIFSVLVIFFFKNVFLNDFSFTFLSKMF
jgi:hypothetical protein